MKRFLVFFLLFFCVSLAVTLAAEPGEVKIEIDEALVASILTIWGLGVLGITELIKGVLKVKDWTGFAKNVAGYVISLLVSIAGAAYTLATAKKFTILALCVYGVYSWGVANGIFKYGKRLTN